MALIVFKPRRDKIFLFMSGAVIFIFAGVAVWFAAGTHLFSIGFTVLGLLLTLISWIEFRIQTLVEDSGMKRLHLWRSFVVPWNKIESWIVQPTEFDRDGDSFTFQVARFHVQGRKDPLEVYDSEVSRPGFNVFLSTVRQYIQNKEAQPGGPANAHPRSAGGHSAASRRGC